MVQGCPLGAWSALKVNQLQMELPDGEQCAPETGIALGSQKAVALHTAPSQHGEIDWSCGKKWEGAEEAELSEDRPGETGVLPVIVGSSVFLPVFPSPGSG